MEVENEFPTPTHFNVRVYGLLIDRSGNRILLSRETYSKGELLKFPGGGLEFGEGTREGLERELQEELALKATVGSLYYINDFFQRSAFRKTDQLLSIYYLVDSIETTFPKAFLETMDNDRQLKFEWIEIEKLAEESLTFPIDRLVAKKLKAELISGSGIFSE